MHFNFNMQLLLSYKNITWNCGVNILNGVVGFIVQGRTDGAKLPIKNFCFDDYRYLIVCASGIHLTAWLSFNVCNNN